MVYFGSVILLAPSWIFGKSTYYISTPITTLASVFSIPLTTRPENQLQGRNATAPKMKKTLQQATIEDELP